MIRQLTGMDVANASMYDGSTAVTEAALMALRITGRSRILAARSVHPEYREVLRTCAKAQSLPVYPKRKCQYLTNRDRSLFVDLKLAAGKDCFQPFGR